MSENVKTGQIEEKEYIFFKKNIDRSVKGLGGFVPDWNMPSVKELLKSILFFQFLDEKTINKLLSESKELVFENNAKVIKVNYFLLLFI